MPSEDRYIRLTNLRSASVGGLVVEGLLATGKSGNLRAYDMGSNMPFFDVAIPSGSLLCRYGDTSEQVKLKATREDADYGYFLVRALPVTSGSSVYTMLNNDSNTFIESVNENVAVVFNIRSPQVESILDNLRESADVHLRELLCEAHTRIFNLAQKGIDVSAVGDYHTWPTRQSTRSTAVAVSSILAKEYEGELATISLYYLYKELGPAFVGHPQVVVSVVDDDLIVQAPTDLCSEIIKEYKHGDFLTLQENVLRENDSFNEAVLSLIDGPAASAGEVAKVKEEILDEVTCWLVQQVARLSFSLSNMQAVSAKLREAGSALMMAGSSQL